MSEAPTKAFGWPSRGLVRVKRWGGDYLHETLVSVRWRAAVQPFNAASHGGVRLQPPQRLLSGTSRSETVQPSWNLLTERFTGGLGQSGSSHFYQAGPDPRPWPLTSFNGLMADEATNSPWPARRRLGGRISASGRLRAPEGRAVRFVDAGEGLLCSVCSAKLTGGFWGIGHVSLAWRGVFFVSSLSRCVVSAGRGHRLWFWWLKLILLASVSHSSYPTPVVDTA